MITYERMAFQQDGNVVFVEVGIKTADQKTPVGAMVPEAAGPPDAAAPRTSASSVSAASTDDTSETLDQSAIDSLLADTPEERPESIPAAAVPAEDSLAQQLSAGNLDFILDIPLELSVQLGKTQMPIRDLLDLDAGSIVKFSNLEGETLDILANKKLIARGKVVIVNEKYGLKITEIVGTRERINSLK